MTPVNSKKRYSLYDSLTLLNKYDEGWSKWESRSGELYVFKHLKSDERKRSMVGRVYKNRKYFSGLFTTKHNLEFSGDMLDKSTGERVFLLFDFSQDGRVRILRRVS